jgi:hypothetical protein
LVSIRNDVKHTWQAWEDKPQVGPMDVKLSQPTNLIQMNIDVTFKCNTIAELVKEVQTQIGAVSVDNKPLAEQQISTEETQASVAKRLGLFSMKGFSTTEDQASSKPESQ